MSKDLFINKIVSNMHFPSLNPLICGREKCLPSHDYGPATRSYWLLHFVVSGKGVFSSPRGSFNLCENDIFIIRPFEITYYQADRDFPWDYIWLGFSADMQLPSLLYDNDKISAPKLKKTFLDCINPPSFLDNSLGYEHFLCGKIWEIFSFLVSKSNPQELSTDRYIKTAISIMESEYVNNVTVSDIAHRLHLNRSYFSELFKMNTLLSPDNYLRQLKMNKAAELLTKYNCSVSVTASSVGYPDVFSFSRAFKKYFGISPSLFAKSKL